jgi:outer membrane lipoprotein SlyB
MRRILIGALAVAMLAGCATQNRGYGARWEPVVDVRASQQAQYPTDLAECQAHATKVMSAEEGAVAGAIGGAVFGALLGAAAGGNGRFNSRMAGVGAVSGAAGAAGRAEGGQRGIISRCLAGRGYSVLN